MKIGIVADDLTGANANCSLMKKLSLSSASVFSINEHLPRNMDVIAIDTDSRSIKKDDAFKRVFESCEKLKKLNPEFISKRIDSTMRGNVGIEIEAVKKSLGNDYVPIVMPVYPDTNRMVINSNMYVNGNIITNTDAGKDSKTPVLSSNVIDEIKRQYNGDILAVNLDEIEKGPNYIKNLIERNSLNKAMVFDGIKNEHIDIVSKALVDNKKKFFTVDPGPLTQKLAEKILYKSDNLRKTMLVIGSVTDITIEQIRELLLNIPMGIIKVDVERLIWPNSRNNEIEKKIRESKQYLSKEQCILITSTPFYPGEKKLDFSEISSKADLSYDEIGRIISSSLGTIAKEVLKSEFTFTGLFSSGGDITVEIANQLGANAIDIQDEVMPLIAFGRFIGGKKDGLNIITKGGMVGERDSIIKCVKKLKNWR